MDFFTEGKNFLLVNRSQRLKVDPHDLTNATTENGGTYMSVICRNKYGIIMTIIDCDSASDARACKISWEKNHGGTAEIEFTEEEE